MTLDPYSPPKSVIRDVARVRLLAERPRQIIHAALLLGISIIIAVPLSWWGYQREVIRDGTFFTATLFILLFAFGILVAVKIWQGRNWARITFLVLALLSDGSQVAMLEEVLRYSHLEIMVSFVSFVIDCLVVYLLFTKPGSLWFQFTR